MQTSNFEVKKDEFKPFVLQIEVQTLTEAKLLSELLAANHRVPKLLYGEKDQFMAFRTETVKIMTSIFEELRKAMKEHNFKHRF